MKLDSKCVITFDENAKEQMLDIFNKAVDREGYIVEKSDINQRVLTPDGEPIHVDEWAGVRRGEHGGLIFFKNDLISLIELSDIIKTPHEADLIVGDKLVVEYEDRKVIWEWIGEGWNGDYEADNPDDEPLLRFSCYERERNHWNDLPDSSYCTRMPYGSPMSYLMRATVPIMEAIQDVSYKRELERLSWFEPGDFVADLVPKRAKRE